MLAFIYGCLVYLLFLGSFAYAVAFLANIGVPVPVDGAPMRPPVEALGIDLALLSLFALQHSVMARRSFKAWWTTIVPPAVERSSFVLASSAALFALCWYWQPIGGIVWSVRDPVAVALLDGLFWAGWVVLLVATFLLNHFELFGLRQVWVHLHGGSLPEPVFRTPLFYNHVRHPIYLGFVMAFWAVPEMTWGHLLFSGGATGYILVGIWFEERDLIAQFGARYRTYRDQVPMLFPRIARRKGKGPAQQG